jgi:hypothetical protein
MNLKHTARVVLAAVFCCMLLDGVVACLWRVGISLWPSDGKQVLVRELPLGSINGIACDADGRIYVGSEAYDRVQVYSQDGRFLYGIDVSGATANGAFSFRIAETGQLEVYGIRTNTISYYGQEGLVGSRKVEQTIAWGNVTKVNRGGGRGILSLGEWSWLWPTVVETDTSGGVRTVVRQSVWMWLLRLPVPAMWLLVVGFIGMCWALRLTIVINGRAVGWKSRKIADCH